MNGIQTNCKDINIETLNNYSFRHCFNSLTVLLPLVIWFGPHIASTYLKRDAWNITMTHQKKGSTLFFLLKIPFIFIFEDHKNGRLKINLSAYLCITEKLFRWTTILTNIYQLGWRIKTCGGDTWECNFNTIYHIAFIECLWLNYFIS